MSLFRLTSAMQTVANRHAEHKETRANKPGALTWQQKKYEAIEAKQRRLQGAIDALEQRADVQDQWNDECQNRVQTLGHEKEITDLFPPFQCSGCGNTYAHTADNFPGMGVERAMNEGIDRLCASCMKDKESRF